MGYVRPVAAPTPTAGGRVFADETARLCGVSGQVNR